MFYDAEFQGEFDRAERNFEQANLGGRYVPAKVAWEFKYKAAVWGWTGSFDVLDEGVRGPRRFWSSVP